MGQQSPQRILLIDDDRLGMETLAMILTRAGYETYTVESAEAALSLFSSWVPNIALVDVMLPDKKGTELADLLKAICPDCRIFLFTGLPEWPAELAGPAMDVGKVFAVLRKPIHPEELLRTLSAEPIP